MKTLKQLFYGTLLMLMISLFIVLNVLAFKFLLAYTGSFLLSWVVFSFAWSTIVVMSLQGLKK